MLKCQTAFTEISQEGRNLEIMFTFVPDGSIHNPLNSCTSEVSLTPWVTMPLEGTHCSKAEVGFTTENVGRSWGAC